MACIGSQGELTDSARRMLASLKSPATPEEVAKRLELPLFRVRAGLREMNQAGLVESNESVYSVTEQGRSLLEKQQEGLHKP